VVCGATQAGVARDYSNRRFEPASRPSGDRPLIRDVYRKSWHLFVRALRQHHYALAALALQLTRNLFGISTALVGAYIDPIEGIAALRRLLCIGAEILAPKLSRKLVGLLCRTKGRDVNYEPGVLVILSGAGGRRLWLSIPALSIRTGGSSRLSALRCGRGCGTCDAVALDAEPDPERNDQHQDSGEKYRYDLFIAHRLAFHVSSFCRIVTMSLETQAAQHAQRSITFQTSKPGAHGGFHRSCCHFRG